MLPDVMQSYPHIWVAKYLFNYQMDKFIYNHKKKKKKKYSGMCALYMYMYIYMWILLILIILCVCFGGLYTELTKSPLTGADIDRRKLCKEH